MIAAPQRALHRWKVEYRRVNQPTSRVFRVEVRATDTDDARRQAKLLDPHYGSTTRSPRRLRETT